jgi:hypothetical protein
MIALRNSFLRVVLLTLLLPPVDAQRKPLHRLYSNVQFIEEAGDLTGLELELKFEGKKISGELRNYEGACGNPTQVAGTLDDELLNLHGVNESYGAVKLTGTIDFDARE